MEINVVMTQVYKDSKGKLHIDYISLLNAEREIQKANATEFIHHNSDTTWEKATYLVEKLFEENSIYRNGIVNICNAINEIDIEITKEKIKD